MVEKCIWFDKNKKPCSFKKIDDTNYCRYHQYVDEYSDFEKDNCAACTGCRRYKYIGEGKTCGDCLAKAKITNDANKQKRQASIKLKQSEKEEEMKNIDTTNWKNCSKCGKLKKPESFEGDRGETKRCFECRELSRKADMRRAGRERDYSKELANNPELQEKKKLYKQQNKEKQREYEKKSKEKAKLIKKNNITL